MNTLEFDKVKWVPAPDGDGFGWAAFPVGSNVDGFWEVQDIEGDALCVCGKETAVWLSMLLNKFEDHIEVTGDRSGYCKMIAESTKVGSWDDYVAANSRS